MSNQNFISAASVATFVGDDNRKVPGSVGLKAVLDVTAVPGVDTVQLVIEGKDSQSGAYYTILAAVARSGVGRDVLTVHHGITVAANVSASDVLPDVYRARVVHSAGTSFTYSLGIVEIFN